MEFPAHAMSFDRLRHHGMSAVRRAIALNEWYLIERNLTDVVPYINSTTPLRFTEASMADLAAFADVLRPWRSWRRRFERRLSRGQTILAAMSGPVGVGYICISTVPERERSLGVTIIPAAGDSYGFDLFVRPEFRRHLVGFELLSRWLRRSREAGQVRAFGIVMAHNKPMLLATTGAFGFKRSAPLVSALMLQSRGILIKGTWPPPPAPLSSPTIASGESRITAAHE